MENSHGKAATLIREATRKIFDNMRSEAPQEKIHILNLGEVAIQTSYSTLSLGDCIQKSRYCKFPKESELYLVIKKEWIFQT